MDCLSQNVHIIFYLALCEESCKGTKIGEKFHSTNKADTSDYSNEYEYNFRLSNMINKYQ